MRLIKLFPLLLVTLLLNACGGGGGGGAGGGAASYTVSNCSDTGTDYQTTEYKYMGYGVSGNYNPLKFVCASAAYARGATGNGIKVAVLDTGVLAANADGATNTSHAELSNVVNFTSGSDAVNKYALKNFSPIFGERGAYRLATADEVKNQNFENEKHFFTPKDDFKLISIVKLNSFSVTL